MQNKLKGAIEIIDGRLGAKQVVKEVASCPVLKSGVTIDLISHATSDRQTMLFDEWEILNDQSLASFCEGLQRSLKGGPLGGVRLLGCGTAGTAEGLAAMRAMESKLQVPVYGTRTRIDASSFSEEEYIDGSLVRWNEVDLVAPAPELWRIPPSLFQLKPSAKELFDPAVLDKIDAQFSLLWKILSPVVDLSEACELPGLLLQPLCSSMVPFLNKRGDKKGKVAIDVIATLHIDVLFKFRLLRIWSADGTRGYIFRIKTASKMRKVLHAIGSWTRFHRASWG